MEITIPTDTDSNEFEQMSHEELKDLDGEKIHESVENGRKEVTEWQVIEDAERIGYIESGDIIVHPQQPNHSRNEKREILEIGDDISSTNGMHVRLDLDDRAVVHWRLIEDWLDEYELFIIGTRESSYRDTE